MKIEPKEMSAEDFELHRKSPGQCGATCAKQLLQHVAHQDQQLLALRSELARVEAERDLLEQRRKHILAAHDFEETRALQAEARIAELESLIRDQFKGLGSPDCYWADRIRAVIPDVDQALASAGAEKSKCVCHEHIRSDVAPFHCAVHGIVLPDVASVVAADTSPGASERRTPVACGACMQTFQGRVGQLFFQCPNRECSYIGTRQDDGHYRWTMHPQDPRLVRDVIAAGEGK